MNFYIKNCIYKINLIFTSNDNFEILKSYNLINRLRQNNLDLTYIIYKN